MPSPHSPQAPQHRLFLGPVTTVLLHSQQQNLLLRSHSPLGPKQDKQMGLSPGGLQGSSVRGEKVHQDPREVLEPGEGNRNLPWHTPPLKPLHTSLGTRNPKPRGTGLLPSTPTRRHFPPCLGLLSTSCPGSDIVLLHVAQGLCVGKGLQRIPRHIPFVCFMAAGIAEGARYRVKWQGSVPASSKTPQV